MPLVGRRFNMRFLAGNQTFPDFCYRIKLDDINEGIGVYVEI